MSRLGDKVAVITGASAGIGAATARRFAKEGARLVLTARREDLLETLARETGGQAVAGDITQPEVRRAVVDAAGARVDILVNNAGYGQPGPVESVASDDARRQMEVNFFAAAELIRAVLPGMRKARAGRIVNVSSTAGLVGYPMFGWYCASKHALEGLSDALRLELAPFGIQVALVEPGPVRTEFFEVARGSSESILEDTKSPYRALFQSVDSIERDFLKHAASPEDVANVIFKAATASRPRDRYPVTFLATMTRLALRFLPRSWLDAGMRRQFRIPQTM